MTPNIIKGKKQAIKSAYIPKKARDKFSLTINEKTGALVIKLKRDGQ